MLAPDPELAVAYGLFSVRQARAAGYNDAEIRRNLRKGRWVRSARGQPEAVGRAPLATDLFVRAALAAGPQAVIAFESAAVLHGWDLRHPPDRVQLLRPHSATNGVGYRTQFDLGDLVLFGVVVVTSPVRTALDVAACRDFATGVITLDSALRSKQLTLTDLGRRFAAYATQSSEGGAPRSRGG